MKWDSLAKLLRGLTGRKDTSPPSKWLAQTKSGRVSINPGLGEETDTQNPLLADNLRFCMAYMMGRKRSDVIRESEGHFRQNPADLAHLVLLYGRGGRLSGLSRHPSHSGDDSSTAAPYIVCDDEKIQIEEDYEAELQRIYRKFCHEGLL